MATEERKSKGTLASLALTPKGMAINPQRRRGSKKVNQKAEAAKAAAAAARAESSKARTIRKDQPIYGLIDDPTGMKAHKVVTDGISVGQVDAIARRYTVIDRNMVLEVIGVSERTMQRKAQSSSSLLDTNASDRAMRLSTVTNLAVVVLGSMKNAERWMTSPELSLDGQRPIDLLQSTAGTELVKTLLGRIDRGVYA